MHAYRRICIHMYPEKSVPSRGFERLPLDDAQHGGRQSSRVLWPVMGRQVPFERSVHAPPGLPVCLLTCLSAHLLRWASRGCSSVQDQPCGRKVSSSGILTRPPTILMYLDSGEKDLVDERNKDSYLGTTKSWDVPNAQCFVCRGTRGLYYATCTFASIMAVT